MVHNNLTLSYKMFVKSFGDLKQYLKLITTNYKETSISNECSKCSEEKEKFEIVFETKRKMYLEIFIAKNKLEEDRQA